MYANENWLNSIYDALSHQDLFDGIPGLEHSTLVNLIEDYDGHNRKFLSTFMEEEDEESLLSAERRYKNCKQTRSTLLYSAPLLIEAPGFNSTGSPRVNFN